MLVFSSSMRSSVLSARSFAAHLAGSQYDTRGSFNPAVISMAGYACARTFSYGA